MIHSDEPRWVLSNGKLHHVSDFAHLPPRHRPRALCPECNNEVILRLGKKRVHHFSHKQNSLCTATKPESILHANTKYYLARELAKANKVKINAPCANKVCSATHETVWISGWDNVQVEYSLDTVRPDILLRKGDQPIAAIEVAVTHLVDELKEQKLANINISWIEVIATKSLYEGHDKWTIDSPLPYDRVNPPPNHWLCDECRVMSERKDMQAKKDEEYKQLKAELMDNFRFTEPKKPEPIIHKKNPKCVYCGRRTQSWWYYDPENNTCKCSVCYNLGNY